MGEITSLMWVLSYSLAFLWRAVLVVERGWVLTRWRRYCEY